MAAMQFDLVSPERRLASEQVNEVRLPGSEGDMSVMAGHAATITTLRPGILEAVSAIGTERFVVSGGFAEITGEGCIVLAERAYPAAEMDQATFDEMIAEVRARRTAAKAAGDGGVDEIVRLLADMVAVGGHIGLDPAQATIPD